MKNVFLICNAHIDPVWQWDLEEGIGAVLSTFRAAADYCEEYEGFVFNHNEAMIYQWVEQYEPELFARIQKLVKQGRWNIMGGWYLQPDCLLPNGEFIVRQIEEGRRYFLEKFGVTSDVAINFDPFGHSKGLVQILTQAGYLGYLCCRPSQEELPSNSRDFLWKGFADTEVLGHRSELYNQPMGQVVEKIEGTLEQCAQENDLLVLWGVGNHGGGPSRKDLNDIKKFQETHPEIRLIHATPTQYFQKLAERKEDLDVFEQGLVHTMRGCYTSQHLVKQTYKKLECAIIEAERICSHCAALGKSAYPEEQLQEALHDLLFAQFHDILPGSSIQDIERYALELLEHGLHTVRKAYDQAFFDLCQGLNQKIPGSYPVLVYNPHPFSVKTAITSEFMLADQDHGKASYIAHVFDGEKELPAQLQKERSDIPIHWRKQVAFLAELPPFSMHLYEIVMERKPADSCAVPPDDFCFETERLAFQLNPETGLIDRYEVDGQSMLCQGAGEIRVWEDNEDPWGMQRKRFAKKILGAFRLATPAETAKIAANGLESMKPIRIVEQGPVQTVIEAVYCYGKSDAVIRYTLPRCGVSVKAEIRIHNHEKNAMLKWMLPTALQDSVCYGNTMFGMEELAADGGEMISQDFVMMKNSAQAFGVIHKGVYGSHCENGELGISMLRGAAYCAHPVEDRRILRQDRVSSRIDQGERNFQFVLCGGKKDEFLQTLVQETELAKIPPKAVHWFPAKGKESTLPLVEIDNPVVEISGLKKLRQEEGYLLRLFNASPDSQTYHLKSEVWKLETAGELKGFEIQTFHISEGKVQKSELLDL